MDTRYPGRFSHALAAPMSRRTALRGVSLAGASAALLAAIRPHGVAFGAQSDRPPAEWFSPDATRGGHGQVIIGEGPIYLSHLPMFMFDSPKNHPHHYQVILEVSLPDEVMETYLADRQEFAAPLYTFEPTESVPMLNVILPALTDSPVQSLHGKIIRGHWERSSQPQPFGIPWGVVQEDVSATVERVIYAHEFSFRRAALDQLEYVLFGAGNDLFLAHRIIAAPDFDQILPVTIASGVVSDDQLREGIVITIPERQNALGERLMEGDQVAGAAWHPGTGVAVGSDIAITAGPEFFFEEGELRFPLTNADFAPTDAEIDAGFGFP